MFLNEEFLKLWEELSELNEAKADTQRLIDFAGEDLANRFLACKNKLKAPENDLYYWIKKKTPEELESFLSEVEGTKSKTQAKKDVADQGAELVCESEHWKVYHITTFEASQKYGRDTKWCITGVNNYGDKYWNEYYEVNGIKFYFLITKGGYDSRGRYSKIAIAVCEYPLSCQVFDQQDNQMHLRDIPYLDEINIPGIDLQNIHNEMEANCVKCGAPIEEDEIMYGPHEEYYCKDCFDLTYYRCNKCHEFQFAKIGFFEDENGNKYCSDCCSSEELIDNNNSGVFLYKFKSDRPYRHFEGIISKLDSDAENKLATIDLDYLDEAADQTTVVITSLLTGEIVFDAVGLDSKTYLDMIKAMKQYYADIS